MKSHKIHPLPLCKLKMDKGGFTYLIFGNYGQKIVIPVYTWLIRGAGEPILVDTGCSAEEFKKYTLFSEGLEHIATIEESLARFGLSPQDIKTIIITHLDTDHILNAKKFPNAKLMVQEDEIEFVRNPHPAWIHRYYPELYEGLNFVTIRGDTEIAPGVEAISTPGHTVGSQSVAITTKQGKVVICGMCTIDENFSDEGDITPGIHSDPFKAYESMLKIRQIADRIIPLHSQRLVDTKSIP